MALGAHSLPPAGPSSWASCVCPSLTDLARPTHSVIREVVERYVQPCTSKEHFLRYSGRYVRRPSLAQYRKRPHPRRGQLPNPGPQAEERGGHTLHSCRVIDPLAGHIRPLQTGHKASLGLCHPEPEAGRLERSSRNSAKYDVRSPVAIGWRVRLNEIRQEPARREWREDEMDLPKTCPIRNSSNGSCLLRKVDSP